jgi:uncharacterized protein (TIRG00374 family)
MGTGFTSVIPSLLMERLWDGLWLALGVGVLTFFVPLSPELLWARNILVAIVLAGTVLVFFLAVRRPGSASRRNSGTLSKWKLTRHVIPVIERLIDGVRNIGKSGLLPAILSLSLLKLAMQSLAFLALMWAYGLNPSLGKGLAVFLIAYLGMCIPSTPASAGVFQLFVVIALEMFGVAKAEASGFALVAFVAGTLPLSIIGFFALAQSEMTLRKMRRELSNVKFRESPDSRTKSSASASAFEERSCGA